MSTDHGLSGALQTFMIRAAKVRFPPDVTDVALANPIDVAVRRGLGTVGTCLYFTPNGVVNGCHCQRRVGKVLLGGKYFLCRNCYNVAYSSQSEPRYDRMLRRANKGMWQWTYQRKRFEIEWCENQADQTFLSKFGHLLSAQEREMYFG